MSYKYRKLVEDARPWLGIRPWRRHSLVLLVAGLAYVAIGLSLILTELTPPRAQALEVALKRMPIDVWGCVWIAAGILCVISSRWPPIVETWGYMVLTGLSAGWSATYGLGVIFAHSPASNWSSAITWALMAFLWWAISGLINPDRVVVITEHERT